MNEDRACPSAASLASEGVGPTQRGHSAHFDVERDYRCLYGFCILVFCTCSVKQGKTLLHGHTQSQNTV